MHENPRGTKEIGRRTKIRIDPQVYTHIRKKNGLGLVVKGTGNVARPIIQSTDVRLGPKTRGMESNNVSEPTSCYAKI